MKNFSADSRANNIYSLSQEKYDMVVIGGGITGAGVARDAALRGLRVALVEANDFASGTSSRSSKLIHGGVRYLENLEFHLVFEALSERAKLFNIAPHLVHPLRFLIPIYESSRVGMFMMGLGLWLYDALSLFRAPEMHERLSAKDSLDRLPSLQAKGLKGSYVYSDAYMDDDRLVHETLRSANEAGATCVNYVSATDAHFKDGKLTAIECVDEKTGDSFSLAAKHFVSTVGIWTDELGENIMPDWSPIMRPSKGIHLTFLRERLPLQCAVVMGAESRIVFGIPRHEMVIVGTTDTDYQGDLRDVHSSKEDVDYLLKVANEYFPGANLIKDDIVATYAGIRPLVRDDSGSEGKTSREHTIFTTGEGITFVAGGKYTTYRNMAEEAVDVALGHFSIDEVVGIKPCTTNSPLNRQIDAQKFVEAQRKVKDWAESWGRSMAFVEKLVGRHGLEAEELYQEYHDSYAGSNGEQGVYWYIELKYALKNTMCLSLRDFVLRRVPVFLAEKDHGERFYREWAEVIASELSLGDPAVQAQLDEMQRHVDLELGWKSNLSD